MRILMKGFIWWFYDLWFTALLRYTICLSRRKYIYFVDIDNTIANTHPTLLDSDLSDKERLLSLECIMPMVDLIIRNQSHNRVFIFITARSYFNYEVTRKWLRINGLPNNHGNVILVKDAKHKVDLIASTYVAHRTIVIDDMSYNHELGTVKFYDRQIYILKQLKLKYLDHHFIHKVVDGN